MSNFVILKMPPDSRTIAINKSSVSSFVADPKIPRRARLSLNGGEKIEISVMHSFEEVLSLLDAPVQDESALPKNAEGAEDEPWWFPQLAPEGGTPLGWKYEDTWDNLKDAREQFEALADAYLSLLAERKK